MTVFHTQTLPPDRKEGTRGERKARSGDGTGRGKARGNEGGGKKKRKGERDWGGKSKTYSKCQGR